MEVAAAVKGVNSAGAALLKPLHPKMLLVPYFWSYF